MDKLSYELDAKELKAKLDKYKGFFDENSPHHDFFVKLSNGLSHTGKVTKNFIKGVCDSVNDLIDTGDKALDLYAKFQTAGTTSMIKQTASAIRGNSKGS